MTGSTVEVENAETESDAQIGFRSPAVCLPVNIRASAPYVDVSRSKYVSRLAQSVTCIRELVNLVCVSLLNIQVWMD